MANSDALAAKLAELKRTLASGKVSDELAYELAAAKYEPAKETLLEMLDNGDWCVRDTALAALAQYEAPDTALNGRIRRLLLEDDQENIRVSAAGQLGSTRNEGPDPALKHALDTDPSRRVRKTALESALLLAGMPWPQVEKAIGSLGEGELPTSATLDEMVKRWQQGAKK